MVYLISVAPPLAPPLVRRRPKSGDLWLLDIPTRDTKTGRPLEYPISFDLSRRIDLYLSQFRCPIPRGAEHDGLWPSNKGRLMDEEAIYDTVRRRMFKKFALTVRYEPTDAS